MNPSVDTIDFKPPQAGRWQGPMGLALVVHALLIAALTWGVSWQQDSIPTFEAELWSATAQQAAPRAVEPPPPPPPEPETKPEPRPQPTPKAEPEPVKKAPDIATEQARKRKEAEEKKAADERAKKAKAEQEKKAKAELEKKEREKRLAEEKKKKEAEQKKLAEQRRKEEAQREARQLAEAQRAAREDQMRRIQGLAGATGGPNATGTALRSSGPSSSYAGRVASAIRPNIIYSEDFPASLRTEVEVRAMTDGTITDRRVVRSSGNRNWDDAALRAIDRTAKLPRDTDGRVPSPIVIVVRPTD
ncbi:cell envelope integrity protein TolA [Hydrogenophaga bisanensis]|uniref:Cell envelope integrity protein TolA n=1 Tax=Hydrogenophaga bisanensis TaxID=439611 RepID=A0ABW2R455_9BURK